MGWYQFASQSVEMGTRRRVFGVGDSEKLDAARIPKITDALAGRDSGHLSCLSGRIVGSQILLATVSDNLYINLYYIRQIKYETKSSPGMKSWMQLSICPEQDHM